MKIRELDILLVEDNPGDVLLLVETLTDCGLDRRRFTTVTSLGAIFEHFAAGARADVILLDLNLPDSKGLATLERLWAWLPDKVPIIVLTGHDDEDFGVDAIEQGAEDYLVKGSFTANQLQRALRYAVQRSKIQRSLRESAELFRLLFDEHAAIKLITDPESGAIIDANAAAARFYGWTVPEMRDISIFDINILERAELLQKMAKVLVNEENHFECRHRLADGSVRDVEVYSSLIVFGGKVLLHSIIHDITKRKETEIELERLKAAIEQVGESVIITDTNGHILYANPALEKISGYSREELLGQTPRLFKSGMQGPQFYQQMWESLHKGKSWVGRMINKRKDGSLFTEAATISPVRDAAGELVNFVAVKRDITEHLLLEAQLQQAQKMESVGRLAGGVAHDFNNMLGVILGYTQMALAKCDADSPLGEDLHEVLVAAERSANITRQLLAFARKQIVAPQVLNLNETVEGMLKMLRRLIAEDIRLVWQPHSSLWPVRIDPNQVSQILANLCVNARDAIPGVGTITIATDLADIDTASCHDRPGLIPGEYVKMTVADSGCGMSEEVLEKVFEPFFTTKEVGQGTGLGLATVYGIIKQNDGYIFVDSEIGQGTCFTIYLPRIIEDQASEPSRTEKDLISDGGGKTILLVEDEGAILRLTSKLLANAGYKVLTAQTPSQALSLAAQHKAHIALLLADVIMPEMNGEDLASAVRKIIPTVKCLFMSGYSENVLCEQGRLRADAPLLRKPFAAEDLARNVYQALHEQRVQ